MTKVLSLCEQSESPLKSQTSRYLKMGDVKKPIKILDFICVTLDSKNISKTRNIPSK